MKYILLSLPSIIMIIHFFWFEKRLSKIYHKLNYLKQMHGKIEGVHFKKSGLGPIAILSDKDFKQWEKDYNKDKQDKQDRPVPPPSQVIPEGGNPRPVKPDFPPMRVGMFPYKNDKLWEKDYRKAEQDKL